MALVGGSEGYSFPTDPLGATVRLSFMDAVRTPILPAVVAERVLAAWSRGDAVPEWASEVARGRSAGAVPRSCSPAAASGQTLEWVPVADLPRLLVWPKRLAWRLPRWVEHGWPDPAPILADTIRDLHARCDW